jgi:hypothetical protein
MKYFVNGILLLIWLIFTVILAISMIGMLFVMIIDDTDTWMNMGKTLVENLK